MDAFVDAVCVEALQRKNELNGEPIKTIYFGGGTPSRLRRNHFEQLFDTFFSTFTVSSDAEITLEANPDDLSEEYILELQSLPFNRISIGIQSFNDEELRFLSRRHSAEQAIRAVKLCQENGFENISIDLMYGLPQQTLEIWQQNINRAIELNVPHISAYHLIYEEKTKLYSLREAGKIKPVDDETGNEMFSVLIDSLAKAGFEHYEISNFAREGFISKHNSSYWKGDAYLGLGPAAHSFTNKQRSWNVSSLKKYIHAVNRELIYRETENLTKEEQYNEFILTGLRTIWGVDLEQLENRFGNELYQYAMQNAAKFIDLKLLTLKNNTLTLSREGIFISDGIMSELMWVR